MNRSSRLILASGSKARRDMLAASGLSFDIEPADIDEDAIRAHARSPVAAARLLAAEKAQAVSLRNPDALVIGADQILAYDRQIMTKARSVDEARQTLNVLRGRTHQLFSAFALARNGMTLVRHVSRASLTMRCFSDACREAYLGMVGEGCLAMVGCYAIEGPGITLMDRVDGGHDTIRGLPMLPLLAALRERGMIAA